jgi:hypothetical protein
MARLYSDEDVPEELNDLLRLLGHDVVSVSQLGRKGGDDAQVLADAITEGRAVVTFNRWDFDRLHRASAAHEGIISCTRDDDPAALATRIDRAIQVEATLAGKHVRVNLPSP